MKVKDGETGKKTVCWICHKRYVQDTRQNIRRKSRSVGTACPVCLPILLEILATSKPECVRQLVEGYKIDHKGRVVELMELTSGVPLKK